MPDDAPDAAAEPMTVGRLIAELQKLDPARPVALGLLLDGEEGEVDVYDIDLIEEMEAEDGSPAYILACDLRGEEAEEG